MKIKIIEAYLDSEKQFYDYGTGTVDGSNIFDSRHTGTNYDDFITDSDYMEKEKNLKANIVQMTPDEYFHACAKIFKSSYNSQINQIKADVQVLEHLKEVILKYKKQFPITTLDYARNTQEGRHRMYVAGELFGWDIKFPVMVVNFADEKQEAKKNETEIKRKLEKVAKNSLDYTFSNIEEFKNQLLWDADRVFEYEDKLKDDFKIRENNEIIIISTKDVEYRISKSKIKIK